MTDRVEAQRLVETRQRAQNWLAEEVKRNNIDRLYEEAEIIRDLLAQLDALSTENAALKVKVDGWIDAAVRQIAVIDGLRADRNALTARLAALEQEREAFKQAIHNAAATAYQRVDDSRDTFRHAHKDDGVYYTPHRWGASQVVEAVKRALGQPLPLSPPETEK